MKANRTNRRFKGLVLVTIIAVYLVILAGGIVRATGSGMGCPDWPKCFGNWVPPTSVDQLPPDYQERYAQVRVQKNQKLAGYLELFGLTGLAQQIQQEAIAAPEAAFNKLKTWTEYINRLLGVILGLLISAMTFYSVTFRKNHPALFYGSVAALLLVIFQGWIGSVVVSTNLLPGIISFHMLMAILLIGLLVYIYFINIQIMNVHTIKLHKPATVRMILLLSMGFFLLQIVIGTQVREAVDVAMLNVGQSARDQIISQLGAAYYFHRTFSLLLLGMTGYLFVLLKRSGNREVRLLADLMLLLVSVEVILGITMAYAGIPPWAQPLHLLVALLIMGLQFWIFLQTKITSNA
ncbi:MAG: hypothetical protein DHS20C17_15580 [Cyclobacteriaceae bacterium]|nr:MAG: hypothetical protein DHS20C17_15580 [Cyclobacteriaceae bacterium]